ncbi:hypothetical protein [Halorubrum salinum]|uniref:hypothetical protein n=1 Tax=Halorubrum salinum TaxID=767517 RepID=UPI00211295E4|nr:hypothetical protein [Halorubrum salinum]
MTPTVQFVIAVAAGITATAACATAAFTAAIYRGFKRLERTVYGSDQNEAWNGLMEMALRNREVLEEEGYL